MRSPRLLTDEEVVRIYGDPAPYIQEDGRVAKAWEFQILDNFWLPKPLRLAWGGQATRISCHVKLVDNLRGLLNDIHLAGLWDWLEPYGGSFMWRPNKNAPGRLSRHSWGIALDIRTDKNPNRLYGGNQHPTVVKLFNQYGWVWGGDFPENPDKDAFDTDPMHFEIGAME